MPYFVWFGILGLILLYAAGITILLAKYKDMPHLRRHHPILGRAAAIVLTVHAIWANLNHRGHTLPLFGWVGLLAIAGIFFGYYAAILARKTRDKKWSDIHWKVQVASTIVATLHAGWFIYRIIGR